MSALVGYYNALGAEAQGRAAESQQQARLLEAQTGQVAPTAEAQQREAAARTYLTGQQAQTIVPLSAADIAIRNAQASLSREQALATPSEAALRMAQAQIGVPAEAAAQMGQGTLTGAEATAVPSLIAGRMAGAAEQGARAKYYGAESGLAEARGAQAIGAALSQFQTARTLGYTGSIDDFLSQLRAASPPPPDTGVYTNASPWQQYAKGTPDAEKKGAKGKGMPKAGGPKAGPTDTVPAMLSPGEAVLNRGAAEHVGRGVIDHLNQIGLMKLAARRKAVEAQAKLQAFALGTDKVKSQGSSKTSKATAPQKPSGGDTPVMDFAAGGVVPGYAEGISDLFSRMTNNDATVVQRAQADNGGFVGLGGGILSNWMQPSATGFRPDMSDPAWRATRAAPAAPIVTRFTPADMGGVPGFGGVGGMGAGTVPGFNGVGRTPGFQGYAAGVEEVVPMLERNEGARPGGLPGYAKGATKVSRSKATSRAKATPFKMPVASQVAPPAMTAMPKVSFPQPSYPAGMNGTSFL